MGRVEEEGREGGREGRESSMGLSIFQGRAGGSNRTPGASSKEPT